MRQAGDVRWMVWELDSRRDRTYGTKFLCHDDAEKFTATLDVPYEIEMVVLFKVHP